MNRLLTILFFTSALSAMQAPEWAHFKFDLQNKLKEAAAQKEASKSIPIKVGPRLDQITNNIVWAMRKNAAGPKLIALYVYEGNEAYRTAFQSPENKSYLELRNLMVQLAHSRFDVMKKDKSAPTRCRRNGLRGQRQEWFRNHSCTTCAQAAPWKSLRRN